MAFEGWVGEGGIAEEAERGRRRRRTRRRWSLHVLGRESFRKEGVVRMSKAVRKEGLKSPLDLAVGSVVTAGEFRKWEAGKQKLDGSGDE